jgi:hypothetical protein
MTDERPNAPQNHPISLDDVRARLQIRFSIRGDFIVRGEQSDIIAKRIIKAATRGERDPARLGAAGLAALRRVRIEVARTIGENVYRFTVPPRPSNVHLLRTHRRAPLRNLVLQKWRHGASLHETGFPETAAFC